MDIDENNDDQYDGNNDDDNDSEEESDDSFDEVYENLGANGRELHDVAEAYKTFHSTTSIFHLTGPHWTPTTKKYYPNSLNG